MIEFDARELFCPEFQIQMRRFLSSQEKGEQILIRTLEPRAPSDTKLYCAHSGLNYIDAEQTEDEHFILVEIPNETNAQGVG